MTPTEAGTPPLARRKRASRALAGAARPAARALVPHGAVVLFDALRSLDLERASVLRDAPLDVLADPDALERLLPRLGVAGTNPDAFPRELHGQLGQGLHSFQWPSQFAPYLTTLARYPISRYLEIGVYRGGTFVATVEYLDRFHPVERAWAVDIEAAVPLYLYRRRRPGVRMVRARSGTPEFAARVREWRPDLAFIDGDHSYAGARADFDSVHGVAKAIALHDVVDNSAPGVAAVWEEIQRDHADVYEFTSFTAQYPEVRRRIGGRLLGIGLAIRRDFAPSVVTPTPAAASPSAAR